MKIKTQLTLAATIAAGMLASGCSQMSGQQMAGQQVAQSAPSVEETVETEVQTIVDCSKCGDVAPKPAPAPRPVPKPQPKPQPKPSGGQWTHTHPAVPGCTDSIRHTHKYDNKNHKHKYGCTSGSPQTPRPQVQPPQQPNNKKCWHGRNAEGQCNPRPGSTRPVQPQPPVQPRPPVQPKPPQVVVPPVKAKGNFRGPVPIDQGVMQQYGQ